MSIVLEACIWLMMSRTTSLWNYSLSRRLDITFSRGWTSSCLNPVFHSKRLHMNSWLQFFKLILISSPFSWTSFFLGHCTKSFWVGLSVVVQLFTPPSSLFLCGSPAIRTQVGELPLWWSCLGTLQCSTGQPGEANICWNAVDEGCLETDNFFSSTPSQCYHTS